MMEDEHLPHAELIVVRRHPDQFLTWALLFVVIAGVTDTDWAHNAAALAAALLGAYAGFRLFAGRF